MGGVSVPVVLRKNRRARRYILRLRHDGAAVVTVPWGGSDGEAVRFLNGQRIWLAENLRRHREHLAMAPDAARILEARTGGRTRLIARVWELAEQLHIMPSQVKIRSARSRWGSCSRKGVVTLNWRIALAPELVVDYVIVHELMHLKEHNHGPRFWELVESAFPYRRHAEGWLRREGPALLTV